MPIDDEFESLTPEQRAFLDERRREVLRELEALSTPKPAPPYEDRAQRHQDLEDELSDIERRLGVPEP